MLRWMCGKSRKHWIRNEHIKEHLWIASISDKLRETFSRWFGHVQYRPSITLVRKSLFMKVDGLPRNMAKSKRT